MKTSPTQFEMMVTFMEQNGDLTKPSTCARGRIQALTRWEELGGLLNSDGTGDTRSCDRWKQVWRDLKNNTKKKAAKLHKAATGTGGGPASTAKLTDLEQRVLAIVGVQAATGLVDVQEAGLSLQIMDSEESEELNIFSPVRTAAAIEIEISPPREQRPLSGPSTPDRNGSTSRWHEPGTSSRRHIPPPEATTPPAPTPPPARTPTPPSARFTPPMRTQQQRRLLSTRGRPSPRRRSRATLSAADQAAQNFLHSDSEWRKFLMEQQKEKIELEKKKIELREQELRTRDLELDLYRTLGNRCLDLVEKISNRLFRDE